MGDGTDQHVDVGAGDSVGSAQVEEPRCQDVITRESLEVAKGRHLLVESLKAFLAADTGKDFLMYWSGKSGAASSDEVSPMLDQFLFHG